MIELLLFISMVMSNYSTQVRASSLGQFDETTKKITNESIKRCKISKTFWNDAKVESHINIGIATEGDTVIIACRNLCPTSRDIKDQMLRWKRWRFNQKGTGSLKEMDSSNGRFHVDANLDLHIVGLTLKDSGLYYCFSLPNKKMMALFMLTVDTNERVEIQIAKKTIDLNQNTREHAKLPGFKIRWEPSQWSSCDRCGSTGLSRRPEFCYLKGQLNDVKSKRLPITLILQNLRIPCRSFLVPTKTSKLLENFKTVIRYRLCRVNCSSGIETIKDPKTGKVVDFIDRSKDVFSIYEPLPSFSPHLPFKSISRNSGSSILMVCPGRTNHQMIQWFNGSYLISPLRVHTLSKGRIRIDYHYRLHIRRLETYDSRTFSCKSRKKTIGAIYLNVIPVDPKQTLPGIYKYVQFYIVLISISLIVISIYKNRSKKF